MAAYCKARGIPPPDPATYAFCLALGLFRMAAISAGIGARAAAGNASSQLAAKARFATVPCGTGGFPGREVDPESETLYMLMLLKKRPESVTATRPSACWVLAGRLP